MKQKIVLGVAYWLAMFGMWPLADPGHSSLSTLVLVDVLLHLGGATYLIVWLIDRFRKPLIEPASNHARLAMKSGSTLDLVDGNGDVRAKVVLIAITRDTYGTSAEFVDYYRWIERNRFRG